MSRLIALYPAAWRARYEEEFEDVIALRPRTTRERLDILRGAVDAHLHPQRVGRERIPDRYGVAPLLGLPTLALVLLLAANGPVQFDEYGTYRDGSAALPFFVATLVLVSVGLVRIINRLPEDAARSRAAGWIAILAGPTWGFAPWLVPIGLIFFLGALGLAVGARRAGILPAWSEVVLVPTLAIPSGLAVATVLLPWYVSRESGLLSFVVLVAPIVSLCLVVGGLLLRGFPRPMPT